MKKIFIKITGYALAVVLALSVFTLFTGCDNEKEQGVQKLDAPTVTVAENGLVTWNAVDGADEYLVTVTPGIMYITTDTSYQLADTTKTCSITVTAKGADYDDSDASEAVTFTPAIVPPTPIEEDITVSIESVAVVESGKTLQLNAAVKGTDDKEVYWSIDSEEYATIDDNGLLTAKPLDGRDAVVTVKAESAADPSVFATRTVTVVGNHELGAAKLQAMLDALDTDKLEYSGMLDIDYYTTGVVQKYDGSAQISLRTGMDGTNWYAAYTDNVTGTPSNIFYKNVDDVACQVGLDFMNEEKYYPMYDDNRHTVSWYDSGLYNTLKGLKASDFTYRASMRRYEYTGSDETFIARTALSANPMNFTPKNLFLIIDGDEIVGLYSESIDDYTVMAQEMARMRMIVAINKGDAAKVKTINKFEHDAEHDAAYAKLEGAIAKMHALKNYRVDFRATTYFLQTGTYTYEGYDEYIDVENGFGYFLPYEFTENALGVRKTYGEYDDYGYKKVSDSLYNAFYRDYDEKTDTDNGYKASRAFEGGFETAVPSFAFVADIFTSYLDYEDADGKKYTAYFADESLQSVATTFYNGVGTDAQLFGLYAAKRMPELPLSIENFTPFVTVDENGYIVSATFFFNLYYFYGVVDIQYCDFDAVEFPTGISSDTVSFEARNIPARWADVTITDGKGTDITTDDEEVQADTFLNDFFGAGAADAIPFIGAALGDCYGFGLTGSRMPKGENKLFDTLTLYYDVYLDENYSIDSSIAKIEKFLIENGYTLGNYGVYGKGDYRIQVVDNDLDLLVYVWKAA